VSVVEDLIAMSDSPPRVSVAIVVKELQEENLLAEMAGSRDSGAARPEREREQT